MSITSSDHDTVALAAEFRLLQAELTREIQQSDATLTRHELIRRVAEHLGRWDDDVRLALKRMEVVEDHDSRTIRLLGA